MPHAPSPEILERGLDQAMALVDTVTAEQLDKPTPCGEWTVRELLRHMVGGVQRFRAVVQGGQMGSFEVVVDDDALADDYRSGAAALIAAWHEDGVLDRSITMFGREVPATVPLSMQTTETATHSWDLARAVGAMTALHDQDVAETALDFTTKNMTPEQRGKSFGPERPAPEDASAYDRLAAFTGREIK